MNTTTPSSRRQLLRSFAIFGGAFVASRALAACFSGDDTTGTNGSSTDPTNPTGDGDGDANEPTGTAADELVRCSPPTISENHGHTLVLPPADVTAGAAKTYSIKGSSGHDHKVTISAAQFATLAAGGSVTIRSTNGASHTHDVTVKCGAAPSSPDAGRDAAHSSPDAKADAHPSTPDSQAPDTSTPPPPPPPPMECMETIASNHGHVLVVSASDVASGTSKTYAIKGTSSHSHDVTITSTLFAKLAAGQSISLSSGTGAGHTHTVTVICA